MLGDELIELSDIAHSFLFLYEQGFVRVSGAYVAGRTDAGHLIMRGPKFSIRFILDWNQVFVDIGSQILGWEKLEYLLMFCDETIVEEELGAPPIVDLMAGLLQFHWSDIVVIYSKRSQIGKLKKFCNLKTKEFISRLFPK